MGLLGLLGSFVLKIKNILTFKGDVMTEMIRLSKSCLGTEETDAVKNVLEREFLGMGQEVELFENELRAFLQTENHVICVNTGTSGLHLALLGLGIGPGDEVLVPSITYVATYQAIAAVGATPVSCDVNPRTAFISLDDAQKRLTTNTRVILPVHYASDNVEIPTVYKFASDNKLRVIEDAAHSFGGSRSGKKIGAEGDIICFSFDGIKNITSGEGGAIVTSDHEVADRIRDARLLGVEKDTEKRYQGGRSWDFDVKSLGLRYHMSNIMAAIGRVQLRKITKFGEARKSLVERYIEALSEVDNLQILNLSWGNNVTHIFPVLIQNGKRDRLMEFLKTENIQVGIHYKPNHLLTFFKNESILPLPVATQMGRELLTLPLHPDLSFSDQDKIIKLIIKFMEV